MVNINQIKNQPYQNINFKSKTNTKVVQNPSKAINELAKIGLSSVAVSTFLQDYKKTANDKNYFQLKIDKTTQKHYEPDVFQNAAGMNIFLGNDVLVTAPTGTGKTAIAEYAISRNKDLGKKTFYTTPLKALSNEKFLEFQKIYGKENVGLITGDNKINIDAPILVMTTEVYRNMASSNLFNFSNKEKNTFENLQTVIFDELQYLGDIDRGCVWEQSLMFTPKDVQILSLSATIENNKEINQWLATIRNREAISVEPDKTYVPKSDNFKKNVLINVPTKNRHVPLNYHIEFIEKEFIKMYKKGKILITLAGEKVGSVNGLAVLDNGYYSFGRPIRITCVAYKGTGRIVDIQKESNLSGKIHEKSISILRGLLSSLLNAYENIPVDFHISFEQTYGIVDGDSASIAEIIALLSALSKYKVKQNIAVTGSVNQFGEVQAIGGVSEKIEGFYKVCKIMDTIENKGVLIPTSNRDELIILPEVEEAIINNKFHIYTMENLNDAIEVLMLDEGQTLEMFYEDIKKELKKYSTK